MNATLCYVSLLVSLLCACSSTEDPAPVIDCNVTGPTLSLIVQDAECGKINDGSIMVQVTGGTGAKSITIEPDTGVFELNTFAELPDGDYTVTVTDANNCSQQMTASLTTLSRDLSYQNDIKPIIETNCTLEGCHNGDNDGAYGQNRNWLIFANVQNNAQNIKNRINREPTAVGFMPKVGSLTEEEVAMITCWVDEGALDN